MENQNIRIRLRGFDNSLLDNSTFDIIITAKRTGAKVKALFHFLLDSRGLQLISHLMLIKKVEINLR